MIVNVSAMPTHPLAVGMTMIVVVRGEFAVFVAVKLGMFPVPLTANPIVVFVFVHAKVVPATGLVNAIAGVVVVFAYG